MRSTRRPSGGPPKIIVRPDPGLQPFPLVPDLRIVPLRRRGMQGYFRNRVPIEFPLPVGSLAIPCFHVALPPAVVGCGLTLASDVPDNIPRHHVSLVLRERPSLRKRLSEFLRVRRH